MLVSPNRYRIELDESMAPKEWTSKQAKRIFEAGLKAQRSGGNFAGSLIVASQPPENSGISPFGTSEERAAEVMRDHIAKLRREADRLEELLTHYGGGSFIQQPESLPAAKLDGDIEEFLVGLMRCSPTLIKINGVPFMKDETGAYREQDQ